MITWSQAVWLGLIQGLTEFLPVSSSGHLVIGQHIIGLKEPALLFDISVHVGTLVAVLAVFKDEVWAMIRAIWVKQEAMGRNLILLVASGSVPTALMGILLKDQFQALFSSLTAVGIALIITGVLLLLTKIAPPARYGLGQVGMGRAVILGIAQGCAITPGISRSGATISTALFLGIERKLAARLSFLLSIPAILGALVLHLKEASTQGTIDALPLVTGGLVAAVSGYIALKILLKVVQGGGLHWFTPYCWALGIFSLLWSPWGS